MNAHDTTLARIATGILLAAACSTHAAAAVPANACGEVVAVETHNGTTTRYALAFPADTPAQGERTALVLLAGDGGYINLDDQGCARKLVGNSLVRSLPHFRDLGLVTALVDAPSDHTGDEGLGGFRITQQHAADLGKLIADVRARAKTAVWLVGTSRGAISAATAAARLSGPSAPDGLVLTSPVSSAGAKGWATQTVFDARLEDIRMPVLVVGHAADSCIRSPSERNADIAARTSSARKQVVVVSGGPSGSSAGFPSVEACQGNRPHSYIGQEAEVAAGIARFIRGGNY